MRAKKPDVKRANDLTTNQADINAITKVIPTGRSVGAAPSQNAGNHSIAIHFDNNQRNDEDIFAIKTIHSEG